MRNILLDAIVSAIQIWTGVCARTYPRHDSKLLFNSADVCRKTLSMKEAVC